MVNTKEIFSRLRKRPMILIVNVIGMSLSTAVLLIIGVHIARETSFDKFQKNRERIVRVHHGLGAITPPAYGPFLVDQNAESESFLRTLKYTSQYSINTNEGQRKIFKLNGLYADSTWHRFFELNTVYGDAARCLNGVNSAVLSSSTAQKLFGNTNPIGKIISSENIDLVVTAVVEDYPYESVFEFDVLVNVKILEQIWGWKNMFESFGSSNFQTFLLLGKGSDAEKLEPVLDQLLRKRLSDEYPEHDFSKYRPLQLIAFDDIHFSAYEYESLKTASRKKIMIYAVLALFILLVSIINYINIATVRSFEFAKSMALKKAFGADRFTLGAEIIFEAVITIAVSMVMGLATAKIFMPYFAQIIDKPLVFNFSTAFYILLLSGVPLLVGTISGLYPAFFLTRINAVSRKTEHSKTALRVRHALSLLQFTGTLIVLIAIAVIYLQSSYMLNYDTGLKKDNILKVGGNKRALKKLEVFKDKLSHIKELEEVCFVKSNPINIEEFTTVHFKGEEQEILFKVLYSSPELLETFGIKLIEGRCFKSDEKGAVCLINETAARKIKNHTPLESAIEAGRDFKVIGVVKDFNITSLREEIMPLIIYPVQSNWGDYYVKLNASDTKEAIAQIGDVYNALFPKSMYDYAFVDETYHKLYKQELEFRNLMPILGLFAVVISCLGLFMLTVYAIQKRSKEIAVRKVNGANASVLMLTLNRNIIRPVLTAIVIASPIAYLVMKRWLSSFKYKIELSVWIFLSAGLTILIIALLTTAWQTYRAAQRNPADALTDE